MTAHARDRLIVALDVPGAEQARALIDALQDSVGVYKIGLELLFAGGMALASELASRGNRVFIDAPSCSTSRRRSSAPPLRSPAPALSSSPCTRWTGRRSMPRCADGRNQTQACSASRCSTNLEPRRSRAAGHRPSRLASSCCLSGHAGAGGRLRRRRRLRARAPRRSVERSPARGCFIVTPGIRPQGGATQDQARVATPASAIAAGADYLVVGRPITAAPDPRAAAEAIVAEIE